MQRCRPTCATSPVQLSSGLQLVPFDAGQAFDAIVNMLKESPNDAFPGLPRILAALYILRNGWDSGAGALRFALKCAESTRDPNGSIEERPLWTALTWSSSTCAQAIDSPISTHLRKVWRTCEKVAPTEPEEAQTSEADSELEEGADENAAEDGEEGEAKAAKNEKEDTSPAAQQPKAAPAPRVSIDEFVSKMQEDALLANAWLKEISLLKA